MSETPAAGLPAYEKLGVFYLGRPIDLETGETAPAPFLYDSRDLVTHGLCVGMTGSGKTGLCVSLLEEAALDGIPALVIDPKGDLANLLLTFPDLAPEDFRPWVEPEAARRAGVSVEEHAARQAELWRKGLAEWDQDGERIRRLREAADFTVYTPGSSAGVPVSVLASFAAPSPAAAADPELVRERVATTVSSLLGLVGVDADPVRSREHILLSLLVEHAWSAGRDLALAELIRLVQAPPVAEVGVMPLDTSFYPAKERFELAMALNSLLASPGFAAWLEGEPLDPGRLLYTPEGKPRVAIFSIAHLSDAERMFFVSLLLAQTVGWTRTLSGTGSLRALVYMDEVFGYLPPVAEPPSKRPLLTLLKQGRAFGVGVLLATQNPVDLDYKALSNMGTWFLGRLQTQRDKDRLLDGLEGAAGGAPLDRAELDRTLSALGKRVFLMHDVHEPGPTPFHTRWAMSYLAGPLTRDQIRRLADTKRKEGLDNVDRNVDGDGSVKEGGAGAAGIAGAGGVLPASGRAGREVARAGGGAAPGAGSMAAAGAGSATGAPAEHAAPGASAGPSGGSAPGAASPPSPAAVPTGAARASGASAGRPVLPPEVAQVFLPVRGGEGRSAYHPFALGMARVHFVDDEHGISHREEVALLAPIEEGPPDWHGAEPRPIDERDLLDEPEVAGAGFATLGAEAADPKAWRGWEKDLSDALYRDRRLELRKSSRAGLVSRPGESEGEFRGRLEHSLREARDEAVEALRERFAKRIEAKGDQVVRAEHAVQREQEQAEDAQRRAWLDAGSSLLGASLGRKKLSVTNVRRAGSALSGFSRSRDQAGDVERSHATVELRRSQLAELEAKLEEEIAELHDRFAPESEELEPFVVRPRRSDVEVRRVALAWVP